MEIDGKKFKVNNEEKLLFPQQKYNKTDVMEYYAQISEYMLPHLKNRIISMLRYPDGIKGKNFFQKEVPDYFPDWITREPVKKKQGGTIDQVICNDKATLVYLASQACLTLHIWLSQKENLQRPDKLIFDLDPADKDFSKVKQAAKAIHDFFSEKLKATPYLMTTGSEGLHVVIPIKPELDFDDVLKLSQKIAVHLTEEYPDTMTTKSRKEKRKDKLYLDVMRNAYGQTAVAPYALRALEGAPVATPLEWEELSGLKSAQQYTLGNIFKRMGQKKDPWGNFYEQRVSVKNLYKMMDN